MSDELDLEDLRNGRIPLHMHVTVDTSETRPVGNEMLYHITIWIVDLWDRASNIGPGGGLDTIDHKSHAWITPECLDAEYWKGLTDLDDPAADNPVETNGLFYDDKISSRTGTFPLGDFMFTRREGSEEVSIELKEDDLQTIKIGRRTFEGVKRFQGTGRVNKDANRSKERIIPHPGSATFVWPAMKCDFRFRTPISFKPTEKEPDPSDPPPETPVFRGPLPIPFGGL